MKELIENSLRDAYKELSLFMNNKTNIDAIGRAGQLMADTLREGHTVMSCGNGGSLCDATHFAEELTGRYRQNRRPLSAVAINDSAYMTCTGNDFSFKDVFARYVEGVGKEGDILLGISTSGNSENILRAVKVAHQKKMKVIGLTSAGDNKLKAEADIAICAPQAKYSDRIQEIHIKVIHILIQLIESELKLDNQKS